MLENQTVLVVEKDWKLIEEIKSNLSLNGFKVYYSFMGENAADLAKYILPDLIIIDPTIRNFNQNQNSDFLYQDPELSSFPLIFLSENGFHTDEATGYEHGIFDIIKKPMNKDILNMRVNAFFKKLNKALKKYEQKVEKYREDISFTLPHEFRTSVNSILGCSKMILKLTKSDVKDHTIEEITDMAKSILESGMNLNRLVENFLFYIQIQTLINHKDRIEEMKKSNLANPSEVIYDVLSSVPEWFSRLDDTNVILENANIRISFLNFNKIVQELIDNAFKFSEKGTKVEIQTQITADRFIFKITDYGRGMSEEQIKNIGAYKQFDRYLYEQQGAGLGLIITKHLVTMHDGTFEIDSRQGIGTTVSFSLPVELI